MLITFTSGKIFTLSFRVFSVIFCYFTTEFWVFLNQNIHKCGSLCVRQPAKYGQRNVTQKRSIFSKKPLNLMLAYEDSWFVLLKKKQIFSSLFARMSWFMSVHQILKGFWKNPIIFKILEEKNKTRNLQKTCRRKFFVYYLNFEKFFIKIKLWTIFNKSPY